MNSGTEQVLLMTRFDVPAKESLNANLLHRITSYNVCYTKLLRGETTGYLAGGKSPGGPAVFAMETRQLTLAGNLLYGLPGASLKGLS